jgi:hypothetical protein
VDSPELEWSFHDVTGLISMIGGDNDYGIACIPFGGRLVVKDQSRSILQDHALSSQRIDWYD